MIVWTPGMTLDDLERAVITTAFRVYRENKTATAAALGVSVRTLDNKFDRYAQDDAAREVAAAEREEANAKLLARARGAHQNPVESLVLWPPGVAAAMVRPGAPESPQAAPGAPESPQAPEQAPRAAQAPQPAAPAPQAPARAYGRGRP